MNFELTNHSESDIDSYREKLFFESTYIRGWAILLVLIDHSIVMLTLSHGITGVFFKILLGFTRISVPLFLLLTGYGLAAKSSRKFSVKKYYRRIIPTVLVPYTIYTLIYYSMDCLIKQVPWSFESVFLFLFKGNIRDHFWFGHFLIIAMMIHPVVFKLSAGFLKRNLKTALLTTVVIWFVIEVGLGLYTVLTHYVKGIGPSNYFVNVYYIRFYWYVVLGYAFWFHAGSLLSYLKKRFNLVMILLIWGITDLCFCALSRFSPWGPYGSFMMLTVVPYLLTAIVIIIDMKAVLSNSIVIYLSTFGLYSYGIYYLHILVREFIDKVITGFPIHLTGLIVSLLYLVLMPITTLLVVKGFTRIPKGYLLT